jgi:ferredoxin
MNVSVDSAKCTGHARCNVVAPQVYSVDDDGFSDVGKDKPVPQGLEDAARNGAFACPERALTVTD